jgi:hypothetical protein
MAFQLSPGVEIKEFDLTSVIPTIATTPAGYVGFFQWGPVDQRILIQSEKELESVFGKAHSSIDLATSWYIVSNFLSYGGSLITVRAASTGDDNATDSSDTDGILIKNREDYESQFTAQNVSHSGYTFKFAAKYPGELGNSLKVVVVDGMDPNTNATGTWETYTDVYGIPGTSNYASTINPSARDEIHVIVVDEDGKWSGTAGTILEAFTNISKASDAKLPDGTTNYWRNVVNNRSQYVWVGNKESTGYSTTSGSTNWDSVVSPTQGFKSLNTLKEYSLDFGTMTTTVGSTQEGQIVASFTSQFGNPEEIDVSLLIAGNMTATNSKSIMNIASLRQDCIAFISPVAVTLVEKSRQGSTEIVNYLKTYRETLGSSSYGVLDGNAKYQYDRFNDRFLYVPLCGDIAGCCVRTDNAKEPWYSPAGFDRGRINNIVKLVWNPTKAERDTLYKNNINPVVSFQGSGAILFGDKTLQTKASAFDRINVRRLFNVLEKTIATAAKFQLFEFNDAFTRAQFRQLVEPFLREVQGKRGVSSYGVVCDETNNTASVIDQNQFVADIFVAPARSINFIRLNFIATPTGVTFAEFGG